MTTRGWVVLMLLGAAVPEVVTVKREGARVMTAPRFFGDACPEVVEPGQTVRLLERRGGWGRLAAPGAGRCWLHASAWSDRAAGELVGDPASASPRDVELAARGLGEEEEGRYRADHPDLAASFEAVEAYLERAPETSPEELARFARAGGLGGGR